MRKRIRAVAGGTSASKTISILVWCIDYCQTKQTRRKRVSVVSESYPHLESGAMLDFENLMKDRNYWDDDRWNATKHIYTFEAGNELQFFSADTYGKAHGPRRDVLFLNECNNLDYKIVDQLIIRTREIVWMDWNPSEEFWFYTEMKNVRTDIDFITLTYKDNEALDDVLVREIESHIHNKMWWQVYGLGQLGDVEGKIYKDWQIIDEVPHVGRLRVRCLDFGYSNDPTALVDIYEVDGGFIWDEQIFQKGLSNKQIADFILNLPQPQTPIIADSAEPKSIDELKKYGLTILAAEKGADSVRNGIQVVQAQRISVTKRSVNIINEYRKYFWVIDRDGKVTNVPNPMWNHTMDAGRYGMNFILKKPKYKPVAASPVVLPYEDPT